MKKLLLLALFVAPLVFAQVPKTVTLERATERINGDPLPLAEIARHDIQCLVQGSTEPLFTIEGSPSGGATLTPEAFEDGPTYICRGRTVDSEGRLSDWADSPPFSVARCDVTDCRPGPPKSIAIQLP